MPCSSPSKFSQTSSAGCSAERHCSLYEQFFGNSPPTLSHKERLLRRHPTFSPSKFLRSRKNPHQLSSKLSQHDAIHHAFGRLRHVSDLRELQSYKNALRREHWLQAHDKCNHIRWSTCLPWPPWHSCNFPQGRRNDYTGMKVFGKRSSGIIQRNDLETMKHLFARY